MSPRRVQSFRFGLRFLVIVAILGGATVGVSMLAEAKRGGGASKRAPADNRDCKVDHDCVIVADDCCPCSQGGKARAIPKKQKDTYEKDRKKRCAETACTEMMSDDLSCTQVPFCGAGICELGEPANSAAKSGDAPKSDDKPKADEKPKADDKPKAPESDKKSGKKGSDKGGDKAAPDEKPPSGIEF
jgi:hypothetical protein